MEFTLLLYSFLVLTFIFLILKHLQRKKYHLPPTPARALPIIGHLHILKPPLHRTFQRFSQICGPIFSLKLGARRLVVVSSPELVEECFGITNDVILSNRPNMLLDEYIGYNRTTMGSVPYGPHWRNLRRMASQEVFSAARLESFSQIREDEVRKTLQALIIKANHDQYEKVELKPILIKLIFNIVMRMLAGKRFFGDEKDSENLGKRFQGIVSEVCRYALQFNPEDFLPILRRIDYRGLTKKMAALGKELDDFQQGLVDEHRHEKRNTIIGHLLSLHESNPEFYTDQTIKGFMTSMIFAGTDTAIVTIEWAMSLLLNHPQVLQKAKLEIESQVGHQRLLEEQDLPKLRYLRNIIFETFRMFPPGPLPAPRESSADCKVGGYDIPRGTILIVNVWAIHMDPKVWDESNRFKPERFEGRDVEMGVFMPFGMGRRACPGAGLGQKMVGLVLGSLIQCFDWERVGPEEIDLAEGAGLAMPKLKPLEVMWRPSEIMLGVFYT